MDNLCSVTEAADLLQVSPRTVINLINRGKFKHASKIDPTATRSTWRIPRADIDAYIKSAQRSPAASDA